MYAQKNQKARVFWHPKTQKTPTLNLRKYGL